MRSSPDQRNGMYIRIAGVLSAMQKMKCSVCGHIYDPATGDRDVPAGTDFVTIPDSWVCPVCMAKKTLFVQI